MIEIVICHAVAMNLSYYNAAEGDSWRQEAEARQKAWDAWQECAAWLVQHELKDEFLKAGGYLI